MKHSKSENRKTAINLICSVAMLIANLLVSFFLSPYIIRTIGIEANGFVNLAGSFTTYASLIVTALNAMAARFITFAYVERDYKKANIYYNSVFWGNLLIVAISIIASFLFIPNIDHFIDIPSNLLSDVKILFSLVFLGFFIQTAAPKWDCGTHIANRLDRIYIPRMFFSVFRGVFLIFVFHLLGPRVWFISLYSLIITVALLVVEWNNARTLVPELRIALKKPICSWKAIKELVGSGIWNSISCAGNMLLHSIDLLICNISLGATPMGVLSLSKTIPNILIQLAESLRGAFGPELTILFAKGDKEGVFRVMHRAMRLTAVVLTIPTAGIIVMSDCFYSLWVPTQNASQLRILTILGLMNYVFVSGIVILYSVFTLANKVKYNSIAMMICGIVSTVITLLLIRFTNWDLYAVAGVSCVVGIIRDMCFTIPVTTKFVGLKWHTFYPQVGTSVVCAVVIIAIGIAVRMVMPVDTWVAFFLACGVIAILGLCANMIIVLNKDERKYLIDLVRRKLFRMN